MTPPPVRPPESTVPEPHRIRLRGPWEVRLHTADAYVGWVNVPGTVRDADWAGYVGQVSFYRRFGRPTNLETGDRVRLAFERVTGDAEVYLNGQRLGDFNGTASVDVTDRLLERNRLEVVVTITNDDCGIVGDVVMEIEASDET